MKSSEAAVTNLPPGTGKWQEGDPNERFFVRSTVNGIPADWVRITNVNLYTGEAVNEYGAAELRWARAHQCCWLPTNYITNLTSGTFSNDLFVPPSRITKIP